MQTSNLQPPSGVGRAKSTLVSTVWAGTGILGPIRH